MTRDLDIVVSLHEDDVDGIVTLLAADFYIELQRRDVKTLLDDTMDRAYLAQWAARLGVAESLAEIGR